MLVKYSVTTSLMTHTMRHVHDFPKKPHHSVSEILSKLSWRRQPEEIVWLIDSLWHSFNEVVTLTFNEQLLKLWHWLHPLLECFDYVIIHIICMVSLCIIVSNIVSMRRVDNLPRRTLLTTYDSSFVYVMSICKVPGVFIQRISSTGSHWSVVTFFSTIKHFSCA